MEPLIPAKCQEERQSNQHADREHPQDRSQTKYENIKAPDERGPNGAEDQEHQRRTTRQAMDRADEEGFSPMGSLVLMGVSFRCLMSMEVDMDRIAMAMEMGVDSPLVMLPKDLKTEEDEDNANPHFRREGYPMGYGNPQVKDQQPDHEKSRRVPDAPEETDEQRTEEASAFTHDGGDGHHVVGIERMLHPE